MPHVMACRGMPIVVLVPSRFELNLFLPVLSKNCLLPLARFGPVRFGSAWHGPAWSGSVQRSPVRGSRFGLLDCLILDCLIDLILDS